MKYLLPIFAFLMICSCQSQKLSTNYKQIQFEKGPCFGFCPVYKMTIDQDKKLTLDAIKYNFNKDKEFTGKYLEHEGVFTAKISDEDYKNLVKLIDISEVKKLKDKYEDKNITDLPTSYLTIKFEDGSEKKIQDYGQKGTPQLEAVYQMIEKIKAKSNWKKVN